jgi:methionyl-tRNA formyltransferase
MTKVVFFGNERLVSGLARTDAPVLNGLIKAGYEVVAVVSHNEPGHSRQKRPLEVAEIAKKHGVPLFLPNHPREIFDKLKALGAEVAVLSAYGQIVPQKIIDLFPRGIINIHPSLLPKYRGPSPIETAIANRDNATGLSIMLLTEAMDAGPIYAQTEFKLKDTETKFTLAKALGEVGAAVLLEVLPGILSGEILPLEQDEKQATYCQKLKKSDGALDPKIETAAELDAKVRAYLGFPKTHLKFTGQDVIITKTKPLEPHPGENWPDVVPCAQDTALQIIELINPKSGKIMPVKDYLNGLRNAKSAGLCSRG